MNKIAKYVASALIAGSSMSMAYAEQIKIGIAQFGPHPQLDEVVTSFKQELAVKGYKDVVYDYDQINFDAALAPQLLTKLKAGKPKLILTITTPLSQAAKQVLRGSDIPVVFSAVTDPVAAKLVPSWETGAKNMTGASDLQDLDGVLTFTRKLLPNAKRLAVPFNPGEDNDVASLETLKKLAPNHGFEVVPLGIDNANDITIRIRSLKGKADAIYVGTSNLLQPAIPAVAASASAIKLPIVNGSPGPVNDHQVLAAFAVDYKLVGKNAASLADRLLKGDKAADLAPIRPAYEDHAAVISSVQLKKLGLTLPEGLKDCNCVVD